MNCSCPVKNLSISEQTQEITKISKCLGSPPPPYWLYYNTTYHSKQFLVASLVFSDGIVHFLKIEKKVC